MATAARTDNGRRRLPTGAPFRARPTAGRLLLGPTFDLGSQPELHAALTEVDCRSGHICVALLVLADGVAVGEVEDVGDTLCVKQILRVDLRAHFRTSLQL